MPDHNPFRVAETLASQLAEALCPWCGEDFDRDRHPHAPPLSCPWCQRRARLLQLTASLPMNRGPRG